MTTRVSFLRSCDALAQAEHAYCLAEYSRALESLDLITPPTAPALSLRATVLRRMGNIEEAIAAARESVASAQDDEEKGRALIALAGVQMAMGALDDVRSTILKIKGKKNYRSKEMRSEVGFIFAWLAYCRGDLREAEEEIVEAYTDPRLFYRARARQLHSFIFAARGEYKAQAQILSQSLREFREAPIGTYDIGLRAQILGALAVLSRDVDVPFTAAELREEFHAIPWTSYLSEARYWSCRSIGIRMSQEGGLGARIGIGLLRQSMNYASTPARRVLSTLDAADIAFSVNEPHSGGALLDEAVHIADSLDWTKEVRDERLALLQAAMLFARQGNVDQSRKYMMIFRALPPMAKMMALSHDRRLEAMQSYAEGIIARASGDENEAADQLSNAFAIYAKMNNNWQAALCAFEIYEITCAEKWHEVATKHARAYPNSWLAARIKGVGTSVDPRYAALTPAERRVFDLLVEGVGRTDIGHRLAIKRSTINTHVERIFAKWNVHSQRELIAESQRVK